jgi:hypothetical protein
VQVQILERPGGAGREIRGQTCYGVTQDNDIADVLALVREASTAGHASFPLSAAHYVETYHHREPGRRQRLGADA